MGRNAMDQEFEDVAPKWTSGVAWTSGPFETRPRSFPGYPKRASALLCWWQYTNGSQSELNKTDRIGGIKYNNLCINSLQIIIILFFSWDLSIGVVKFRAIRVEKIQN